MVDYGTHHIKIPNVTHAVQDSHIHIQRTGNVNYHVDNKMESHFSISQRESVETIIGRYEYVHNVPQNIQD